MDANELYARRWKALAKRLFREEVLTEALDARAVWHDKAQRFWDRAKGAELCAALLAGAKSEGDRRAALEVWAEHCKRWEVKASDIQAAPFRSPGNRHTIVGLLPVKPGARVWLERAHRSSKIPRACPFCGIKREFFPIHNKGCTAEEHGLCIVCLHPMRPEGEDPWPEPHWDKCPLIDRSDTEHKESAEVFMDRMFPANWICGQIQGIEIDLRTGHSSELGAGAWECGLLKLPKGAKDPRPRHDIALKKSTRKAAIEAFAAHFGWKP